MSSPSSPPVATAVGGSEAGARGWSTPTANAFWGGWPEVRADLRSSVRLVLVLAVAGVAAGLLWWWLTPRADFRITHDGPVVIGNPSEELLVATDAIFTLILFAFGLSAGAAAWFLRRRRGVATVLALAVGGCAMAVVAWRLGELLGAGPSAAQLGQVGGVVTNVLRLRSLPALAVGPFGALLAYLVPVVTVHRDDLGRSPHTDHDRQRSPEYGGPLRADELSLASVPPRGRPTG